MVKQMLYLVAALNLMWMLCGCGCPPDRKLGEFSLIKPQFLQLTGTESMTYINSSTGETIVLHGTPFEYILDKLIVANLCSKPPFSSQVSYYESVPFFSKRYRSSAIQYEEIDYFYKVHAPIQGDTTSFIDLLTVNGRQFSMAILVSDRGKSAAHSLPLVSGKAKVRIIADTTIQNQHVQQVYCQVSTPTVYFTPDRGSLLLNGMAYGGIKRV